MEALAPSVGSNQFVTKFVPSIKAKKRFSFKLKLRYKLFALVLLLSSLYLNFYLLKTNYVSTCWGYIGEVKQEAWGNFGHFMNRQQCDSMTEMKLTSMRQPAESFK